MSWTAILNPLSRSFDKAVDGRRLRYLERGVVVAASVGFLLHLGLIAAVRNGLAEVLPWENLDRNYLHAVYTPFTLILFYEVLQLALALPSSLTSSIAKQFEIVSLIVVRRVFKDIGEFEHLDHWFDEFATSVGVLTDMLGALGMFLLVALFHQFRRRHQPPGNADDLASFIAFKKVLALLLATTLIGLATFNLATWAVGVATGDASSTEPAKPLDLYFFPEFFELMIFADVLLLLVSIAYYEQYEYVFRNAGFVISTVLLRASLTSPKPYDLVVALVAMLFGLAVLLVFNHLRRVRQRATPGPTGDAESEPFDRHPDFLPERAS